MRGPTEADWRLPWGSWLDLDERGRLVDADGRAWRSIREAFWVGRLGLPGGGDGEPAPAGPLETVREILAERVRREAAPFEHIVDVMEGNTKAEWWIRAVLEGRGLITARTHGGPADRPLLLPEGRAALAMLEATRPHPAGRPRPRSATVDEMETLARPPGGGEDARRAFEAAAEAGGWDALFRRDWLGGRDAVTLHARVDAPVPVRRMVWSIGLPSREERDQLFDFLVERLDRWPTWAAIATRHRAEALTTHLLAIHVALLRSREGPSSKPAG